MTGRSQLVDPLQARAASHVDPLGDRAEDFTIHWPPAPELVQESGTRPADLLHESATLHKERRYASPALVNRRERATISKIVC